MTMQGYRRLCVCLAGVCLLLLLASGYFAYVAGAAMVRAALADEQTDIFVQSKDIALTLPPAEAITELAYVVGYYPSGTKQVPGSALDRLVERCRKEMVAAIIQDLRARTGQDFGDDPDAWIRAYRASDSPAQ